MRRPADGITSVGYARRVTLAGARKRRAGATRGALCGGVLVALLVLTGCATGPISAASGTHRPTPHRSSPSQRPPRPTPTPSVPPTPASVGFDKAAHSTTDPASPWVVVNKARPLAPIDFAPGSLADIPLQMTTSSGQARADVASAAGEMADAAAAEGAGRIGANNGYRSYDLQVATHASHVRSSGQAHADASSARAGHSEHQTGLAIDLVACDSRCGAIESFGATAQGEWIAANAWEYGFIVRYEQVGSGITGYKPEPWHLRYLGRDLAAAYHHGGYHTLEEFFGLPAAPDYAH